MITLYEHDLVTAIADLDNVIINSRIEKAINNKNILFLTLRIVELKTDSIDKTYAIKIENQFYRIVDITYSHSSIEPEIILECEHIQYDLNEVTIKNLEFENKSNSDIVTKLLENTDFVVKTITNTEKHTFKYNNISARAALIDLANGEGLELLFNNKEVSLLNTIGRNMGYAVQYGKNLKGVKKISKKNETTRYEIDLVELSETEEYKSEDLQFLESANLGDLVIIRDPKIGIYDEREVIVSITYNPLKKIETKLEIASRANSIAESVAKLEIEKKETNEKIEEIEEIISDGSGGISSAIEKRLELLESNNAFLINLINKGRTENLTDLGLNFENGVLIDSSIVITMESIDVKDIKSQYNWFDTNTLNFSSNIKYNLNGATKNVMATDYKFPDTSASGLNINSAYYNGNLIPPKIEVIHSELPLNTILNLVYDDSKYLDDGEYGTGLILESESLLRYITMSNTRHRSVNERIKIFGWGNRFKPLIKAGNLKFNSGIYYIIDNGVIKKKSVTDLARIFGDNPTDVSNVELDTLRVPSELKNVVAFDFTSSNVMIVAYELGTKIARFEIIGNNLIPIRTPQNFKSDFIFMLGNNGFTYNTNNGKLYEIKNDNVSYYTGYNIVEPLQNGNVHNDEFYYFFDGKLKTIRKKV